MFPPPAFFFLPGFPFLPTGKGFLEKKERKKKRHGRSERLSQVLVNSENNIYGVITESKSGRQAILASRVVDCTGNGGKQLRLEP